MSFLQTIRASTGITRYYVNGRRVTRCDYINARVSCRTLDAFTTRVRGDLVQQRCEGR